MAKLLFSDIDGTLINTDLEVTPKTRDAIRRQIINGNVLSQFLQECRKQ